MASLLFTAGGAVMNALAFSGTNFLFNGLMDHDEKERKRHDLALESFKEQEMNGMKIERNNLILSTKGYVKEMGQGHISIMLMRQCLSTIEYLQNK